MCRSIKTLRRIDAPATPGEIDAAALQFVRKISGYRVPSRANADAFDEAVADVAAASSRLLEHIGTLSTTDRSTADHSRFEHAHAGHHSHL